MCPSQDSILYLSSVIITMGQSSFKVKKVKIKCKMFEFNTRQPQLVGLMVRVSASHLEGCGFAPRPSDTKDYHKNGTNCLCLKGGVMC